MILALTRHIATAYVSLKSGRWEPGGFQGMELHGKTLGLVGLGPIGQEMARLGAGIGMKLVGWTRNATPDRARHGLVLVPLPEVFSRSDVVSIHLSLRPETEHLVSRAPLPDEARGVLRQHRPREDRGQRGAGRPPARRADRGRGVRRVRRGASRPALTPSATCRTRSLRPTSATTRARRASTC